MRKPSKFGKYLLLDRIAVGGMAEVFVAKAFGVEGFERLLAIKKILPTMGEDPEFISMFVDEARIAVQLSHANIVQILELGKHDENLYIAMEYIAGRDVRQVLERFRKKGRPMPVPVACMIIAKVCEALDYAHRKLDSRGQALGIVHRDVSPQNVLVSYDGDVKLIDFGIAKAESRLQKTQAGILKGKFSYMSPEQVRGLPIDHRSDVFAVGVVLWELLTGEKLFTGDSDFAVLEKVRKGDVPAPRQLNPAIPETLQTVVMKALKAEVPERYQWASELHDDLMRFCLVGDMLYGSRQLAEWLREEFAAEAEREQERLRVWMSASAESTEMTPPARLPPAEREPERRPEPRSLPTQPDRPSLGRSSSMNPPAPELPSIKAALAALATPAENGRAARADDSREFRVPKDSDTLVAPPTPPGGSPRLEATPSIFSRPLGELAPFDQTPAVALSLQELPTMKMDADVLAQAERALLAREEQRKANASALVGRDDEPTNKGSPEPSHKITVPEGVFAAMVASSMQPGGAVADNERGRASGSRAAALNGSANGTARPAVQRPASALLADNLSEAANKPLPLSMFDEPTRTLPLQRPKPEEKVARQRREQAEAEQKKVQQSAARLPRIVLAGVALGVVGLLALWFSLRPEPRATGTLVVTVRPLVPAELFLDGKSVGSPPYVGRGVLAGAHQLEVKAQGFKTFSRAVTVQADPRPLEVQADLSSDAPPPLVAPDVVLNGRNKAPAEPPPEPAPARAEVAKAVEAARERPQPAKAEGPPRASPTYESRDLDAPPSVPVTVDPPTRRKVEVPARAALREPAAVARPQQRTETAAVPSAAEPEPQGSNAQPKLRITTDPPGALVLVDGKAVGKSPVIALGLDPSHYHAVAATLDGYSPLRRAAKLEASGTTLMHLALLPQGAAAPQARPAQAETAATTLAGPVGYLIAATSPVARVQIDGRETGRWTPVPPANPIALPAGDHTIEFVTASGQKLAEQVTIEAGKTKSLIRKLR